DRQRYLQVTELVHHPGQREVKAAQPRHREHVAGRCRMRPAGEPPPWLGRRPDAGRTRRRAGGCSRSLVRHPRRGRLRNIVKAITRLQTEPWFERDLLRRRNTRCDPTLRLPNRARSAPGQRILSALLPRSLICLTASETNI